MPLAFKLIQLSFYWSFHSLTTTQFCVVVLSSLSIATTNLLLSWVILFLAFLLIVSVKIDVSPLVVS